MLTSVRRIQNRYAKPFFALTPRIGLSTAEVVENPFTNFIQTDIHSVFTMNGFDNKYEEILIPHKRSSNFTFSLPTKYVHPKEFNYTLPNDGVAEFAFVGRSNVGKSSLISTLLNNKNLVKISKSPGCKYKYEYIYYYYLQLIPCYRCRNDLVINKS